MRVDCATRLWGTPYDPSVVYIHSPTMQQGWAMCTDASWELHLDFGPMALEGSTCTPTTSLLSPIYSWPL